MTRSRLRHAFAFSLGAFHLLHQQQTHTHQPSLITRLGVVSVLHILKMPGAVTRAPAKRALAETSSTRTNVQPSPHSSKKLKLQNGNEKSRPPTKTVNGSFNSSQVGPSQFEETLEKMTQDMETLKKDNTEKDQQWRRPALPEDFNEMTQNLVFQQIEAEEGVLNGGKTTVKLFGVTEVRSVHMAYIDFD